MSVKFTVRHVLALIYVVFMFFPPVIIARQAIPEDTLVVQSACVLFYSCSKTEYDSLFQEMSFSLDSLVQQHEKTRRMLIPFLNKMNLPFIITRSYMLIFHGQDTVIYIRKPFRDLTGIVLFSASGRPDFLPKMISDVEAIGRIRQYFQLH
jgi:hypothetical protein